MKIFHTFLIVFCGIAICDAFPSENIQYFDYLNRICGMTFSF